MTGAERRPVVNSPGSWKYWPEIDGLRVVAVLSVFIFHLDKHALPGGFVGVDIFFVISGYLISSILLDDLAEGKFSIVRFYQRRIARIFPALILVVIVTFTIGSLIFLRNDLASLGVNSAYAAISVINLRLVTQESYFTITPDSQPLLHFWSLAVEEQFYLFFPVFIYVVTRFTRWPLRITAGAGILSFALCIVVTWSYPTAAFYLLPTRAWELLTGVAIAQYRAKGGEISATLRSPMAWLGLALMVASVILIGEKDGFPGWRAAAPVFATALLLSSISFGGSGALSWLRRPSMVAIGKRSYSLYLWHWPVFCLVDYYFLFSGDGFRLTLKIVLSALLTILSYRYVERPARRYLNDPRHLKLAFAGAAGIAASVAIWGLHVRDANLFEAPPVTYAKGGLTVQNSDDHGVVVLIGDSQATMYGPLLAQLAREKHFTLHMLAASAENHLPGAPDTHWPGLARYILSQKPDIVIFGERWSDKLTHRKPLDEALATIAGSTRNVILLQQPPFLEPTFSRATLRDGRRPPFFEPGDKARERLAANALLASIKRPRVQILAVADHFTMPGGAVRALTSDGRQIYFDQNHVTTVGAELIRPELASLIDHDLSERKCAARPFPGAGLNRPE